MPNEKTTKKTAKKVAKPKAEKETPIVEEANEPAEVASAVPSEPKTKAADEDSGVVEVSKSDLEAFMGRLNTLEEDNKRLLAASDKGRMFAISEQEKKDKNELPRVKLTKMDSVNGKTVIAWQMGKNESYVDGNRLVEHQTMHVFYEDGTSEEMPLLDFYRRQNKETIAEIKSRTQEVNDEGKEVETLKVETKDGKEYTIGLKFVN